MLNLFRMDFHRLLHAKVFYISLIFLTIMAISQVITGGDEASLEMLLGIASSSGTDDFLTSSMGSGVIFILLGIILTLFVCRDYSGGFAKNIFTVHANPWDYIGGKLLTMVTASALMLLLYTLEALVALAVTGHNLTLPGGVIGLVFFIIGKWVVSCAFSALLLLVNLLARSSAVGIIAGFLIATGGLTMGLSLMEENFNLHFLSSIVNFTISGSSQLSTLSFDFSIFLQILLTNIIWLAVSCLLCRKVLLSRDV